MKRVTVEATFPELKGRVDFVATGEATSVPSAVRRALEDIFSEPKVKGKRIKSMKLLVSVITLQSDTEEEDWTKDYSKERDHESYTSVCDEHGQ